MASGFEAYQTPKIDPTILAILTILTIWPISARELRNAPLQFALLYVIHEADFTHKSGRRE